MALDECVRQVAFALISGPPSQSYSVPPIIPIWGKVINKVDAFELWSWRRFLRVLWTARRCNQSILKEISPEYSMEGLMLKLKLQYFSEVLEFSNQLHLMQRTDSLAKTLMLGKIEGRRRGWQWVRLSSLTNSMDMTSLTRWTWVWTSSGSWWWTGKPGVLQSMGSQRVGHDWANELNWKRYWNHTESVLLSLWNYVRNQYQKIFENNPHNFKSMWHLPREIFDLANQSLNQIRMKKKTKKKQRVIAEKKAFKWEVSIKMRN